MAFDLGELLKDVPKLGTDREQIEYIRLDHLDEDPNNFYQLSGIDELAANIELCGLQQPIRVRAVQNSDHYTIVSGHRRRKAVELLAQDDPARWEEIPCIVEQDEASPALQQLRLIYANANTRTMTSAEISEQAVQVEKLLYQLKEDGYEFPGRMRDHVAQAVGQSKSKLARLKVIRDNLAAVWKPSWDIADLSESTAYELAKIPKAYQSLLFEEKGRTKANIKYLYSDDVKKFAERCEKIEKMTCGMVAGDCAHYEGKMRKAAAADRWGFFHCDNKCCKDCPELARCKAACSRCQDLKQKLISDAKEAAKQEKLAAEEKNAPAVKMISELWQRFGRARGIANATLDDCKKALSLYQFPFDEEKTKKLECGEMKITAETKLPYGYNCRLSEIRKFVAIADLLGCSLDWLFLRTNVRELATSENVPSQGTEPPAPACTWYPAEIEPPVGIDLAIIDSTGFIDQGKYKGGGIYTGLLDPEDTVWAWSLMPTEKDLKAAAENVPTSGTGWSIGKPEAYGTYAAYVEIEGTGKRSLKELLWTGDEWLLHGSPIDGLMKVTAWIEQPEI